MNSMRRTYKRKSINDLEFYKKFCEANKAASETEENGSEVSKKPHILNTPSQEKVVFSTSLPHRSDENKENLNPLRERKGLSNTSLKLPPNPYEFDDPPSSPEMLRIAMSFNTQKDMATLIMESKRREEECRRAFRQSSLTTGKVDPRNMFLKSRMEDQKEGPSKQTVDASVLGIEEVGQRAEEDPKEVELEEQTIPVTPRIIPPLQAITANPLRPVLANEMAPEPTTEIQKKPLKPRFPQNVQIIAPTPTVPRQTQNMPRNALLLIRRPSTATSPIYQQRRPQFVAVRPQNRPIYTPFPRKGHLRSLSQPSVLKVPATVNKSPAPISLNKNFSSLLEGKKDNQKPTLSNVKLLPRNMMIFDSLPNVSFQIPSTNIVPMQDQTEDSPNSLLIKSRFKSAVVLAQNKQKLSTGYEDCTNFLDEVLTRAFKDFIAKCIENSLKKDKIITPEVHLKLKFLHDVEVAQAERKKRELEAFQKTKEAKSLANKSYSTGIDQGCTTDEKAGKNIVNPFKENRIKLANEVAMAALGSQKPKPVPKPKKVYITTEDMKETLRSMKGLRGSMFIEQINTIY